MTRRKISTLYTIHFRTGYARPHLFSKYSRGAKRTRDHPVFLSLLSPGFVLLLNHDIHRLRFTAGTAQYSRYKNIDHEFYSFQTDDPAITGVTLMCHIASMTVMYVGLAFTQLFSDLPDIICVGLGIIIDTILEQNDRLISLFFSCHCTFWLFIHLHVAQRHELRSLVESQVFWCDPLYCCSFE